MAQIPFADLALRLLRKPAHALDAEERRVLDSIESGTLVSRDAADEARHGRVWTDIGSGGWDARGVRFTTVLDGFTLYDGRATAEENWEERTGIAVRDGEGWRALPDGPHLQGPDGGLRYADAVALPGGDVRWFYEVTRPDGAHELRTVLLTG